MPGGMRSDIAAVLRVFRGGSLGKYVDGWRLPIRLLRQGGTTFSVENSTEALTRSFAGFVELLLLLFAVKKVSLAAGLTAPPSTQAGGTEPVIAFLGGVLGGDFISLGGVGLFALLFAVIAKGGMANWFLGGRHVPPFALMSITLTFALVIIGGVEVFVALILGGAALLLQGLLSLPQIVIDGMATLLVLLVAVILVRGIVIAVRLALRDLDVGGPGRGGTLCLCTGFLVPVFPIAGVQWVLGTGG